MHESYLSSQLSQEDHHQTVHSAFGLGLHSARSEETQRHMVWKLLYTSQGLEWSNPTPLYISNNEVWSIYETWDSEACIPVTHRLLMIAPKSSSKQRVNIKNLLEEIIKGDFRG